MTDTFRRESRREYVNKQNEDATLEQINTGSLQRIADAAESMAKGYAALERRAIEAERGREYWRSEAEALKYKLRAARGVITKLKRKLAGSY